MPRNKRRRNPRIGEKLAGPTGGSMPKAMKQALRGQMERAERVQGKGRADRIAELNRIALFCANLPVHDGRSGDEILGYDSDGLPS